MKTGENSIIEARMLYHSYTRIHSPFISSKIQLYDVMVVYVTVVH